MRKFTSTDAKNRFGELVDAARLAPVAITKYDRPFVVVMAVEEYERLIGGAAETPLPEDPVKLPKRQKSELGASHRSMRYGSSQKVYMSKPRSNLPSGFWHRGRTSAPAMP